MYHLLELISFHLISKIIINTHRARILNLFAIIRFQQILLIFQKSQKKY